VIVRLVAGGRTLTRRTGRVTPGCDYAVTLRLPRDAAGRRLRALVSYGGDAELLPRAAIRRPVGAAFGMNDR
jgi:hypothetical protein